MERSGKILKVARILHASIRVDDLYNIEQLGVEVSPKCGPCRCRKCQQGGGCMSLKDERD